MSQRRFHSQLEPCVIDKESRSRICDSRATGAARLGRSISPLLVPLWADMQLEVGSRSKTPPNNVIRLSVHVFVAFCRFARHEVTRWRMLKNRAVFLQQYL